MNRLLTVKDIQNRIGCGRSKVYEVVNSNGFPKIKIGKQFYVPEDEFNKWVSRHIGKEILIG